MTYVKQRKGWRMSCDVGKATKGLENICDVGEATERLENELCPFNIPNYVRKYIMHVVQHYLTFSIPCDFVSLVPKYLSTYFIIPRLF